jgi:hypothetical protein
MVQVTNTTQLSTFSLIRGILLSNSTLSSKFKKSDFYEFDIKPKSSQFGGFPCIIIQVPDVDDMQEYLGNIVNKKEFEIEIVLLMDYLARSNYASYASALITALDSSESTLAASGYHFVRISGGKGSPIVMDSKELIEGRFILTLEGEVGI